MQRNYQTYLIDGGSHIDTPLTNMAIKAFYGGMEGMIADKIFPVVPVGKQSDGYYVLDPNEYLRVADTRRSPKTAAKMGEWKVSTDTYFANNYAFGTDHAKETLANADMALQVRSNSTNYVLDMLARDRELRVANQVTSISNVGSGVALTGANKWSDYVGSDPISDILSGHAFIRNNTGLRANTLAMDYDTHQILKFHPLLRDYLKYVEKGPIPDTMLQTLFGVGNLHVADAIYNGAKEGATASLTNVWGNFALLCHVDPNPTGLQVATFGIAMEWKPEGFPAPMAVERYDHHDKSKKAEVIEAQYFCDEKIVARNLSYLLNTTL